MSGDLVGSCRRAAKIMDGLAVKTRRDDLKSLAWDLRQAAESIRVYHAEELRFQKAYPEDFERISLEMFRILRDNGGYLPEDCDDEH